MVGNGVTDYRFDNDIQLLEMTFWYGFISTETYLNVKQFCLGDTPDAMCEEWETEIFTALDNVNIYDSFGICYNDTQQLKPVLHEGKFEGLLRVGNEIKPYKKYFKAQELTPFLINPVENARKLKNLKLNPPCVYASPLIDYMNNANVRTSLHIPPTAPMWELCNGTMNTNYAKYANGSIDVYVNLQGKYRILIYSGDTDMAVPTYGTRDWIDNLNWTVTQNWKQFYVDGQVGGYAEYRKGGEVEDFEFATIHGAGHMAPQWRRGPTYKVISNFINNQTLLK